MLCRNLINAKPQPIRTNAICPWMTKTRLVSGIEGAWAEAGLPSNEPMDVAKIIAGELLFRYPKDKRAQTAYLSFCTGVMADGKVNGGAMYVEGGRAWDVEIGIDATDKQWMGAKQAADFARGNEVLGTGEEWKKWEQPKK